MLFMIFKMPVCYKFWALWIKRHFNFFFSPSQNIFKILFSKKILWLKSLIPLLYKDNVQCLQQRYKDTFPLFYTVGSYLKKNHWYFTIIFKKEQMYLISLEKCTCFASLDHKLNLHTLLNFQMIFKCIYLTLGLGNTLMLQDVVFKFWKIIS